MNGRNWDTFWQELGWMERRSAAEDLAERLRQRAEQYARSVIDEADDERQHIMLTFALGDETYGVDALLVQAVRLVERVVPVPGVPDFYAGVVNIRGNIITVMDLRTFFGIAPSKAGRPQELIVIRSGGLEIGLLTHQVRDMRVIAQRDVAVLDDMQYALGVTVDHLVLLDIERLLTDARLIVGGMDG